MTNMPRLKDGVRSRLRVVGTAYGLFVMWVALGNPSHIATFMNIDLSRLALSLPSLTLVLIGWLDRLGPSSFKEIVVFWRLRERLPGHRAFTTATLKGDSRINQVNLKNKLGKFPTSATQQNATWYGLYQKHTANPSVSGIHFDYLLYRDLAWLGLIGSIVTLSLALIVSAERGPLFIIGVFSLTFTLITTVVARNSANRFVTTVLALESSS